MSSRIFEKYSEIKFHENPSSGTRVIPYERTDGRTDRYDEANSRFSKFCKSARKDRLFQYQMRLTAASVLGAYLVVVWM